METECFIPGLPRMNGKKPGLRKMLKHNKAKVLTRDLLCKILNELRSVKQRWKLKTVINNLTIAASLSIRTYCAVNVLKFRTLFTGTSFKPLV